MPPTPASRSAAWVSSWPPSTSSGSAGRSSGPQPPARASASSTWCWPRRRRSCSARSRPAGWVAAARGTACTRASAPRSAGSRALAQPGQSAPVLRDVRFDAVGRRARRPRTASSASTTSRARSDEPRPRQRLRARRRRGAARLGRGRHPARAARLHGRRAGRQGGARGARAGRVGARRTPASCSRRSGSRSTSRRPTCARSARASTCRWRSRSSPPAGSSSRSASRAARSSGELSLTGEVRAVRGALAIAEGVRRRAARPARRSRAAGRARRRSWPEIDVLGVEHLQEAVEVLRGEREPAPPPCVPEEPTARRRRAGPERRPRPQRPDPGARGRRRGRAQPVPARPAGHGQDDARAAAAVAAAADDAARGDRGHAPALDRRAARRRRPGRAAAVPRAAPHDLGGRASSAAARSRRPARRRSPTTACSSSTSCPSSRGRRWRRCASRSRTARVTIVRAQRVMMFPTRVTLVAASNPCPCGMGESACRCSAADLARHQRRLSGPLLDRIDVSVTVGAPVGAGPAQPGGAGVGRACASGIVAARERQTARLAGTGLTCNAQLSARLLRELRRGDARRPAPALRAARPQPPVGARPRPHPARRAHGGRPGGVRRPCEPDHILRAASLRLDDQALSLAA